MELLATVPLLIIDDLGMRKLGPTAAEELLEIHAPLRTREHAGDFEPFSAGQDYGSVGLA